MAIKLELTGIDEQLVLKTLQLAPYSDFGYEDGSYAEFASLLTQEERLANRKAAVEKARRVNDATQMIRDEGRGQIKAALEDATVEVGGKKIVQPGTRNAMREVGRSMLSKRELADLKAAEDARRATANQAKRTRQWNKADLGKKAEMLGEDIYGNVTKWGDDAGKWIKANPLKAGAAGIGTAGVGAAGIYALTRPRRRD
jgi:hypothetical protein